jgi:hypothetical protein
MKKTYRLLAMILLSAGTMAITSCGGSGTKSESAGSKETTAAASSGEQLFGKLPDIVMKYREKIDDKQAQIKKNKDLDRAFRLSKEMDELKEEADKTVGDYISDLGTPLTVPLVQEGNTEFYKITELRVESAKLKNAIVKSTVQILKEPFPGTMVYIQLFDGDQPTGKWILLMGRGVKKAGESYEFSGGTNPANFAGVTKAVVKTEDDYKTSMKK